MMVDIQAMTQKFSWSLVQNMAMSNQPFQKEEKSLSLLLMQLHNPSMFVIDGENHATHMNQIRHAFTIMHFSMHLDLFKSILGSPLQDLSMFLHLSSLAFSSSNSYCSVSPHTQSPWNISGNKAVVSFVSCATFLALHFSFTSAPLAIGKIFWNKHAPLDAMDSTAPLGHHLFFLSIQFLLTQPWSGSIEVKFLPGELDEYYKQYHAPFHSEDMMKIKLTILYDCFSPDGHGVLGLVIGKLFLKTFATGCCGQCYSFRNITCFSYQYSICWSNIGAPP